MTRPLTNQQRAVYDFIREKIVSRGYGPTVREIGEHMNIKSPNGVMCHLRALERKGMILRTANKSRAIELTERIAQPVAPSLRLGGVIRQSACRLVRADSSETLDLTSLFEGDQKIGLQVQDDSLSDWSIRCGDWVIVELRSHVQSGQLAIVQLPDATGGHVQWIRSVFAESGQIRLQAANRAIATTTVERVEILGVLVGLIRQFGISPTGIE